MLTDQRRFISTWVYIVGSISRSRRSLYNLYGTNSDCGFMGIVRRWIRSRRDISGLNMIGDALNPETPIPFSAHGKLALEWGRNGGIAGSSHKGRCGHVPYILKPDPAPEPSHCTFVAICIYIYIGGVPELSCRLPDADSTTGEDERNWSSFSKHLNNSDPVCRVIWFYHLYITLPVHNN